MLLQALEYILFKIVALMTLYHCLALSFLLYLEKNYTLPNPVLAKTLVTPMIFFFHS